MIKRYLLFGYENYYPSGGWDDFLGAYDSIEHAKVNADKSENEYSIQSIVDLHSMKEILAREKSGYNKSYEEWKDYTNINKVRT